MKPALQLWTVRAQLAENPETCIQKIAKLGIEEVEGFDLINLMTIFPLLKEYGIRCKSSFLFWPHITGNTNVAHQINYPWLPKFWGIEHELDLARKMNLDTLVMGYWHASERSKLDHYKELSQRLNLAGESCKESNINLLYHHHGFEFQPIDGELPFNILVNQTENYLLNFELDTFWLEASGQSTLKNMQQLRGRVMQMHIKNGLLPTEGHLDESKDNIDVFTPLDLGDIDIGRILDLADLHGISKLYLEQDYARHIYQDLSNSIHFLRAR